MSESTHSGDSAQEMMPDATSIAAPANIADTVKPTDFANVMGAATATVSTNDAVFTTAMGAALDLARTAASQGDVPVGAIVLDAQGTIIGQGYNCRQANQDPLAHAEVLALRDAAHTLGSWKLDSCTLVVTLEPCPMCAGAAVSSHIGNIVFGAWDSKMGACGSVWDIARDPHIGAHPQIIGDVRQAECMALLADFFAQTRVQ